MDAEKPRPVEFHPARRSSILPWGLALAVTALLALNNAHYFFRAELFEFGDVASNSLQVRNAKAFREIYGNYSRWEFHHPGPAYFYCYAAAEWLLYDTLRVVPTPYNAHVFAQLAISSLFFAAAIAMFSSRLRSDLRGYFFGLALLTAAWHFTAIGTGTFLSTWSPHVPALPMLCLLVAGASIASGQGRDLPWLALAGGFLVHGHVAQPLFVVPIALLGYAGLWLSIPATARWPARVTAAWRAHRESHLLAAAIIAIFLLPIAIDATRGSQSNLWLFIKHLERHQGESKPFADAVGYFLNYGTYTAATGANEIYGTTAPAGSMLAWGALIALPPFLFIAWSKRRPRFAPSTEAEFSIGHFIGWFYAVVGSAVGLTLLWGMKQDGPMYFFNAFFNYSIYYCFLLLGAAAVAGWLQVGTANWQSTGRRVLTAACLLAAIASGLARREGLQARLFDNAPDRVLAATVAAAVAAEPLSRAPKLLAFEPVAWPVATAIALQLRRLGREVLVPDRWAFMFGPEYTLSARHQDLPEPVPWRITNVSDPAETVRPLREGYRLSFKLAGLNPAGGRVDFSTAGNFQDYEIYGWSESEGRSAWSDGHEARIDFVPASATADVWMTVAATPLLVAGRIDRQDVAITLNGSPLASSKLPAPGDSFTVRIPRELWNKGEHAKMIFRFANAASPASLGLGDDGRILGAQFLGLQFSLEPPRATP